MNEVGIYISCFNAEKTISPCLRAVLRLDHPVKDVILVDDGSTDKTIEIASEFPVRIIRRTENRGLSSARNTAFRSLNTEFVAALDADCLPENDWLEMLMKRFDSSSIAGVGGRVFETGTDSLCNLWRSVRMKQGWGDDINFNPPFLFGSNTVFRKEAIVKVGFYNENFRTNSEDVDISEKIKGAGYYLVYEPRAVVKHAKNDDGYSLLHSFWRWNLQYYKNKGFYLTPGSFNAKIKDNIGLANRFIEEDIKGGRINLCYLDFLLAIHHSFMDFEYFSSLAGRKSIHQSRLPFWISLLDLTLSYHLAHNKLSTLAPKYNYHIQNFFAFNLMLGKFIHDNFKGANFKSMFYRHLTFSVYKIDDPYLCERLLNLSEFHQDWSDFLSKLQDNLDVVFLNSLFKAFSHWAEGLRRDYPQAVDAMEKLSEEEAKQICLT